MKIRYGHLKESAQNEFKNKLDLDNPDPDTVVGEVLSDLESNVDDETKDLIRRLERLRQSCHKNEEIVIENLEDGDGVYYYDVTLINAQREATTYRNCDCTEEELRDFKQEFD